MQTLLFETLLKTKDIQIPTGHCFFWIHYQFSEFSVDLQDFHFVELFFYQKSSEVLKTVYFPQTN